MSTYKNREAEVTRRIWIFSPSIMGMTNFFKSYYKLHMFHMRLVQNLIYPWKKREFSGNELLKRSHDKKNLSTHHFYVNNCKMCSRNIIKLAIALLNLVFLNYFLMCISRSNFIYISSCFFKDHLSSKASP